MEQPVLVIDHNDSFTNNLVAELKAAGLCTVVHSYTWLATANLAGLRANHRALVLSPGPGHPFEYPLSLAVAKAWPTEQPLLGVCLGMQIVLHGFGGEIRRTRQPPVHGRRFTFSQAISSRHLPNFSYEGTCVLYNSLCCELGDPVFASPSPWLCLAADDHGAALVAEHRYAPHILVQYHPESAATEHTKKFFTAFAELAGDTK